MMVEGGRGEAWKSKRIRETKCLPAGLPAEMTGVGGVELDRVTAHDGEDDGGEV